QRYVNYVQPQVKEYLDTHPSTLQALQFLFTRIYEHVFQFPEAGYAFRALGQEVLLAHPGQADINENTGFVDMIQTILLHVKHQGDVRRDIPLEKLTRYLLILFVSCMYALRE